MNKRQLLNIALCTLLASGCSPTDVSVPDDHLIRFGGLEVSRKIIQDNTSFADGDAMAVFGVGYQDDVSQQYQLFDNTPVTLWGTSWGYDAKAYWMEGHSYCFRAFYPHRLQLSDQTKPYSITTTFDASHHYEVQHFTVSRNPADQVDLMVSDVISRGPITYKDPTQMQPVSFKFNHLLTNVHLKVFPFQGNSAMQFRLTSVRLVGMKSTASCSDGNWSSQAQPDNVGHVHTFSADEGVLQADGIDVWPEGLLLIPQDITADMKLVIDFVVKRSITTDGHTEETTTKDSRTIPLTAQPLWQKSKRIDYKATIDSNSNITLFVAKVEPWEIVENNQNIIVK